MDAAISWPYPPATESVASASARTGSAEARVLGWLLDRVGNVKPNEPHSTRKFPKVALPARVVGSLPAAPRGASHGSPRESDIPGFSDDEGDVKTARIDVPAAFRQHPSRSALPTVLTTMNGINAGQVFAIERAETTLGRGRDAHVRVDDVGISRLHARIVRLPDGRHVLEDRESTNGVFLNAQRVERIVLEHGDRIRVGPSLVLRYAHIEAEEEALARRLYETSVRDPLTGVYNRRYLTERLTAEVAYAHRHGTCLGLVFIDLDHFKRINDDHSHLAGDAVLRAASAEIQRQTRTEDVFARYGGEEFVVLVRGIEHKNVAVFAERLRGSVQSLVVPWEPDPLRVTASLGAASLHECAPRALADELVLLADQRVYRSKTGGRNRVSF